MNSKKQYRRNVHKGRYKDMRKYLGKINWNNTLKNKTATECWNILKSEIKCIVVKFYKRQKTRETVQKETLIERSH